jgi:anti-anti-sigma factor
MEITRHRLENAFELKVKGRLDANWAGHLGDEVAEVLRQGARSIRLNMKEVEYVSSAGIRVLFQTYKQINAIHGTFAVTEPSEAARSVLELAGVADLLFEKAPTGEAEAAAPRQAETFVRGNARFEILESRPSTMTARVIGSPELLTGCQFHNEHCRELPFGQETLGIGLGAFGNNFDDCKGRFGEFLAAAGVAAYLPTDGSNVADYILSTGQFVPRLQVLYGLTCTGDFSKIVYFESRDNSLPLTLREIVEACREMAGTDAVAVAMIAESAGLMGAALRRSPALEASPEPAFEHPQIRHWLSFTAERAYARSLAFLVGVATSDPNSSLNPIVRPLAKDSDIAGHFHAASFSYHPLKKGETNLKEAAGGLFELENLQGVMHLLNDERESGAGQSEFFRGACWIGSIAKISAEK